jgi:hypothetical protein
MRLLFAVTLFVFLSLATSLGCWYGDYDNDKGGKVVPISCESDTNKYHCHRYEFEWGIKYGCGPCTGRWNATCHACKEHMCNRGGDSGATSHPNTLTVAVAAAFLLVKLAF